MKFRFAIICTFLILAYQSRCQTTFRDQIWNRFYEVVKKPVDKQLREFKKIQNELVQHKIITDSTYTNLLFLYAGAQLSAGNSSEAQRLLKEAINISTKFPDRTPPSYLSKYHFYLGYYQAQENQFDLAVKSYNISYELGIKQYNKWKIPSLSCQALAHLYYITQDYNLGLKYSTLGAQIDRQYGDSVNLTKNIYEQCINLNELDRSALLDQKVDSLIRLSNQYANDYEKALYFTFLGEFHFKRQHYEKSLSWFLKASRIYKAEALHNELADIYLALSYVYEIINDETNRKHFDSLAFKYAKSRYTFSSLYSNRAFFHKNRKEYKDVLFYCQKALTVLSVNRNSKNPQENPLALEMKRMPNKEYAFKILYDKAEILSLDKSNKTNLKYARNTYLLLDTLIDYIRWQHQGIATKLFWREKLTSLYEQALETCYQLNDLEKAFYFLEKSRAVLLLDQLNSNAAQSFLPKAEAKREATLRMQVSHYQNNSDQNEQLNDFLQAQAKLDEYVKDLEKHYPRYYEYKYNNHVPTLAKIQQYLTKSKQSLLSYYEGKNGVYILIINPQNSYLKKINSSTYYSEKQLLKSYFSNNNRFNQQYDQYLQVSNRFYQLFLAPIKTYLTQRVIVSTSGAIVPFAALSTSAQKPDYLVQQHAFSYTYSARALLNNPMRFPTENEDTYFLGIAPVHFPYKSSLASLLTSANALKDNRKLFRSSLLLTNEKANKSDFEDQWPQAKVVQLISHAYADQEAVQPVIYFADSGLSLNDINQQRAQTQLLVLSACRTGMGKDYKGEGVFSLSRGFMGTGVPSIYSTLWDVEDQDAYAQSYQILKSATKQIPLDLALQMAQLDWLSKADRSKQLPNAWAGIILLGSSNPLPPEPISYSWIFYMLAICLLLVLGFWWWFRHREKNSLSK